MKNGFKTSLYYELVERDGLVCGICSESLEDEFLLLKEWAEKLNGKPSIKNKIKRRAANISIDHIVPKSIDRPWERGQTIYDERSNLQLAHITCNTQKGNTIKEKPLSLATNL